MGLFGILLALTVLMWLAYRGWSVLLVAPAAAMVAAAFSAEPLLAHWTQTFMGSAAGFVAQFLHVPGGREYLAQVPGVATAALPDDALAELLNWSLLRFDPAHVPGDFTPYTAAEMGRLRQKVLRVEAPSVRAGLVARFASAEK